MCLPLGNKKNWFGEWQIKKLRVRVGKRGVGILRTGSNQSFPLPLFLTLDPFVKYLIPKIDIVPPTHSSMLLAKLRLFYILITNLMHWLLFIHKILYSSTCYEPQVIIFRRIQLYTCSIWYCHSLWEWQYHMLHVYNCNLLKMSIWGSKHIEEKSILWINNNQCIKLVINI